MGSNSFAAQSSNDRLQQTLRLLANRVTTLEQSGGGIQSITGISPVIVDNTDPQNPVIYHTTNYNGWQLAFQGTISTFLDANIGSTYTKIISAINSNQILIDVLLVNTNNIGSKDNNISIDVGTSGTSINFIAASIVNSGSTGPLCSALATVPPNFATFGVLPYCGDGNDQLTVTLTAGTGNLEDYNSDTTEFRVYIRLDDLP